MNRLGPYLTKRDIPLWLAVVGLGFLAVSGALSTLHDASLLPIVVLIVGIAIVVTFGGRILVRRLPYTRITRVIVAIVALATVIMLLPVSSVLFPAAVALLAVEMMAAPPREWSARNVLPAPPDASRDTGGFDWPEEPRPTR